MECKGVRPRADDAGHRIRVTLTGADKTNARTPEQTPPPRLTVWREAGRGSWVELPLIPGKMLDSPH